MKTMVTMVMVVGVGWASAATAGVPLCVTSPNAATGLQDAASRNAAEVTKRLMKDKEAMKLLTLVDCDHAVVLVVVGGRMTTEAKTTVDPVSTLERGVGGWHTKQTWTSVETTSLIATLAVPAKGYTTELEGKFLEKNIFTMMSSPAGELAKEIKRWMKQNAAGLSSQAPQ